MGRETTELMTLSFDRFGLTAPKFPVGLRACNPLELPLFLADAWFSGEAGLSGVFLDAARSGMRHHDSQRLKWPANHLAIKGCVAISIFRKTMSEIHDHD